MLAIRLCYTTTIMSVLNVGDRLACWTLLERRSYPRATGGTRVSWLCRCDCGVTKEVIQQTLQDGQSRSCGCLVREERRKRMTKHGQHKTRLWKCWRSM